MKILLVYPGTRHSTYDVALGWHEALSDLGHTVFPFHFEDYLDWWAGAIEYWKDHNPDFHPEPAEQSQMWTRWASEPLIIHIVENAPDLILIIGGLTLHAHTYELMSRFNIPRAVILTECPYIDAKQSELLTRGHVHLAFVNDKNSVAAVEALTGKPAVYLPHSYSPARHYPAAVGAEYETDVYFHGTWWPERAEALGNLNCNGHNVRIVGVGWSEGVGHMQNVTANDELANWYRGTRIALNHHRTVTQIGASAKHIAPGAAWSIGPRAYEIAACGAFQLCDDTRPELAEVFGQSVPTYHDAADLQRKVDYYLTHDGERRGIADAARAWVTPCSFAKRAEEILLPAIERYF
jgi:spore maturation protein CgeB